MKRKTSITLSEDIVRTVDRLTAKGESRSKAIERLLREGVELRSRQAADERDRLLLNRHAQALNSEIADVLDFQEDV